LAVDLSLASLAYAARMTERLGISNITYQQADILELSHLDLRFAQVECVGVLHHLDDPSS
jgi:2-polyprenyl-3-methyl-5-hydroxy-6-metoxy-1,4-benzoquinol methylase